MKADRSVNRSLLCESWEHKHESRGYDNFDQIGSKHGLSGIQL
jgi:hypothetical protein